MQRIICHWTAGGYRAKPEDKHHYHFILEGNGREVIGDYPVSANAGPLKKGQYAAHTRACNTGSIGLAVACMHRAKEKPLSCGKYPMRRGQFQAMVRKAAELSLEHDIEITPETVLSHAEVEPNLDIRQRGKWDFTVLPFKPRLRGAKACGDYLRKRVEAQREKQGRQIKQKVRQQLREKGSRTIAASDMIDRVSATGAALSALALALEQFAGALLLVPRWLWPVIAIGLCGFTYWQAQKIQTARIEDHQQGIHTGRREEETILQKP